VRPRLPDRDTLRALLSLRAVPGLGDIRLRRWLESGDSPAVVLDRLLRARPDAAAHLDRPAVRARIEHALRTLEAIPDVFVLPSGAPAYPRRLLELHDPPAILFGRGDARLAERAAIAIVGTRANTEYGADVARMIAAAAAQEGIVVISGLAHGIDRHAHEAVLDSAGPTIGVIGCGIDVTYPPQHARLQERIACEGLLLTEFAPGEPALGHHFPRRNRIIAALASAVVVVEAPARSGALITAGHALELGREVLAVPGPIGRRTSEGTNELIRDGAGLVLDAMDVIAAAQSFERTAATPAVAPPPAAQTEAWPGERSAAGLERADRLAPDDNAVARDRPPGSADAGAAPDRPTGSADEDAAPVRPTGSADEDAARRMLATLAIEPIHADALVERSGLPASRALACLLHLELGGKVRQHPGSRFSLPPHSGGRPRSRNAMPGMV